jgi:hypothetical protein
MEDLHDFENLTIREIFKNALGEVKADELLSRIKKGIEEGKRGDDLKVYIYRIVCELDIIRPDICDFLQIIPQIVPKHISP